MSLALDIASWILIVGGALLMVVCAVGMLRFPDFFTRLHAASLADTGGAALLLLGMALQAGFTLVTVKLALIAGLLLLTAPTASHAVGHAGLLGGLSPEDPSRNQSAGPDDDRPGED